MLAQVYTKARSALLQESYTVRNCSPSGEQIRSISVARPMGFAKVIHVGYFLRIVRWSGQERKD